MQKDPLLNEDNLETRLMGFLADHFEQWFTVEELSSEQAISSSLEDVRDRIEICSKKVLSGKGR